MQIPMQIGEIKQKAECQIKVNKLNPQNNTLQLTSMRKTTSSRSPQSSSTFSRSPAKTSYNYHQHAPMTDRRSPSPQYKNFNRHQYCAPTYEQRLQTSPGRTKKLSSHSEFINKQINNKPIYERANDILKEKAYKVQQKRMTQHIQKQDAVEKSMTRSPDKTSNKKQLAATPKSNKSNRSFNNFQEPLPQMTERFSPLTSYEYHMQTGDASLRDLFELKRLHDLEKQQEALRRAQYLKLQLEARRREQELLSLRYLQPLRYEPAILPYPEHPVTSSFNEGGYRYSPVKHPSLVPINLDRSSSPSKQFKKELLNPSRQLKNISSPPKRDVSPVRSAYLRSGKSQQGSQSKKDTQIQESVRKMIESNRDEIMDFLTGLLQKNMSR